MDEIRKSTDNRCSEYETLLFVRDKLRKEAYAWKNRYLAEFGDLITAVFEQKIACIKKKKSISFCQMAVNRGKPVDQAELQNYLSQEMKEYNRKLSEMIQENEIAHSGEIISEETAVLNFIWSIRSLTSRMHLCIARKSSLLKAADLLTFLNKPKTLPTKR